MPEIHILVKAKDEVSNVLQDIIKSLANLSPATVKTMAFGVGVLTALGTAVAKLAYDAAQIEPVRLTFEDLAIDLGTTSDALLDELRPAVMHTIGDLDLMRATNKLMIMGLAESQEEAAELARLGVGLGAAMGEDALTGLEKFTNMLATQSTSQMHIFGLSAGDARIEIRKLISEGLTREEAFKLVVLDQGNQRLEDLGDLSDTAFVKLGGMRTGFQNVKDEVANELLPVLNELLDEALIPLADVLIDDLIPILKEELPTAIRPAVDALVSFGQETAKILGYVTQIHERWDQIRPILDIGKSMMDIGMPGMMPVTAIRERRVPIPGGMTFEEMREAVGILGGGRGTGGRLGQGVGGSVTVNMQGDVYGEINLEEAIDKAISRAALHKGRR